MSSNKELKVILSKVGWCGHCIDFLPIFNKSKNLIKNNKILKNVKVDFEVYDMEEDKGIFETKYGNLVDKIEGYPTVFLAKVKNDKISETVEIGHSQKSENFIKLITDAYAGFSQQKGGANNNEDELNELYKLKYLKYKAKYLKYKAQTGGEICDDKCKYICDYVDGETEDQTKNKNPYFSFNTKDDEKMYIIKYTGFKTSEYRSKKLPGFVSSGTCKREKKKIDDIVKEIFDNSYIHNALNTLLEDFIKNPKIKHFNQLLVSLIIKYLQNINSKNITGNKLEVINKIYNIIKTDKADGWCKKKGLKLECGKKTIDENLENLINEALQTINPESIASLKIMLSNLKDDDASFALFNTLNITDNNKENFACLCAQIIIEHHKQHSNYNIPLLEIILIEVNSAKDADSFNRENNLLAKILNKILNLLHSKFEEKIIEVFNKHRLDKVYSDNLFDKIKNTIKELNLSNNEPIEDNKKAILDKLEKKEFICVASKIVIDILEEINTNYSSLPQILFCVYQTFVKISTNENFKKIFYDNIYFLRYIIPRITTLKDIPPHCKTLISQVIQNLFAIKLTKLNGSILFDYDQFKPLIEKIYKNRDTTPNPDVFNEDKVKELVCTFPNIATLFLPKPV